MDEELENYLDAVILQLKRIADALEKDGIVIKR